ncbi:putative pentatricopeptide repeat-containing protein [Platanthera zijinensis]|uniref:Pentatricopeptide repeat-containing protein n=1 Tax=Platanthera zijinensis TaxID=2320716 RepID=A0AAP0BU44_9ASPA
MLFPALRLPAAFFNSYLIPICRLCSHSDLGDHRIFAALAIEGSWEDPRLASLFSSALAPVKVSRVLIELKDDPRSAFRFFLWSSRRRGFRHIAASFCITAHILFKGRMYSEAQHVLQQLVSSTRMLPESVDFVDLLQLAGMEFGNSECIFNPGLFDTLFGVLTNMGLLEEANECFYRMWSIRVFPS